MKRFKRPGPVEIKFKVTTARATICVLCALLLGACGALALQNAQTIEYRAQDQIARHFNVVEPLPVFKSSEVRKGLIEIEHAQAIGVQTTTFDCPGMGCSKTSPPFRHCSSIGSPIPTTDELSNPEQPLRDNSEPLENGGGNVTVGEMDPTGIYPGQSSGTYVRCIEKDGSVIPSYWEGNVEVEFAPAVWNQEKGEIEDVGPASYQFNK